MCDKISKHREQAWNLYITLEKLKKPCRDGLNGVPCRGGVQISFQQKNLRGGVLTWILNMTPGARPLPSYILREAGFFLRFHLKTMRCGQSSTLSLMNLNCTESTDEFTLDSSRSGIAVHAYRPLRGCSAAWLRVGSLCARALGLRCSAGLGPGDSGVSVVSRPPVTATETREISFQLHQNDKSNR